MLGGYKVIDLKGLDIKIKKTINGIYEAIESTNKVILLENIVINNVEYDNQFVDVKVSGTDFILTSSILKFTIDDDNGVIGEVIQAQTQKDLYLSRCVITWEDSNEEIYRFYGEIIRNTGFSAADSLEKIISYIGTDTKTNFINGYYVDRSSNHFPACLTINDYQGDDYVYINYGSTHEKLTEVTSIVWEEIKLN